jgi:hypothetical protein
MTCHLSSLFQDAQFDANGAALNGGKLYWYLAGTLTPATTYADSAGSYANPNPIILNSRGEPPQPIWLTDGVSYKAQLNDPLDVAVRPAIDNITGVNAVSSTTTGIEWTASGLTPVYISATQFSVAGDQTSILVVSRRLKVIVSTGSIYGTITVTSYAAGFTTVTFAGDSVALDSSISAYSFGTLSPVNSSIPKTYTDGWGGTATGAVNTFAINVSPGIGAYAAGQTFKFIPNLSNTGTAPTLNVNGIGAKTVKTRSMSGLASVPIGVIQAGQEISVTYDGTYFVVDISASAAGGQTFTANGTFTVPTCNYVLVDCLAAGGGGGSGERRGAGVATSGGGGGGGGARLQRIFTLAQLGGVGAAITVTVGVGGLGGTAITTDNTVGNNGTTGGNSSFGSLLLAYGGAGAPAAASNSNGGGGGGSMSAGSGANGGAPYPFTLATAGPSFGNGGGTGGNITSLQTQGYAAEWGGAGGGASFSAPNIGQGGSSLFGNAGGGAGGAITSANAATAGADGGSTGAATYGGGGLAGAIGANGADGAASASFGASTGGGGGGASLVSVAGDGGAGGPGAGGGGGGASRNGLNSGAGGPGGRGEIRVYWW